LAFSEFSLRVRLPILSEKPRIRGAKAATHRVSFLALYFISVAERFARNADGVSRKKP
jgi:hypothetical protein